MFTINHVVKNTIAVRGKSINKVVAALKRWGYNGFDWEDTKLEAYCHHAGACIEMATVTFPPKGRAITDLVITEPVIVNY